MKYFTPIFTGIIIIVLFGVILNKIEELEQFEQLEYKLEYQIDSLKLEIDTLIWGTSWYAK